MKTLKSLFAFDRKQQRGIFALMLLLVLVVGLYVWSTSRPPKPVQVVDTSAYQAQIDSLKEVQRRKRDTIYAFNPNYITDYRGYRLGLSVEEIDRLHRFRESGTFINTKEEFQRVTQVSDAWLDSIAPYFKFPEWVTRPQKRASYAYATQKVVPKDINKATADELKKVYGIGPALSRRIIEERERLDGYIDLVQVRSLYGITDSTMLRLKEHFFVTQPADFKKIALNTASEEELLRIPYFDDYLVEKLVEQRTLREGFKSWDKVVLTSRFPVEKLALIQLYLALD